MTSNLPLKNRIVCKAQVSTQLIENITTEEHERMVKQNLAMGMGLEFMDKLGRYTKIGQVGNPYEIEYTMEAYVFTKDQLEQFVADIKTI